MTDLLLAIIAVALVYRAFKPTLDNWQWRRRYVAYRRNIVKNDWFDPEINPHPSKPIGT